MTEKYTNNDHQIKDPTLAEHMAYGEKDYRDSLVSGSPEVVQQAVLDLGQKASTTAGLEYIKGEQEAARIGQIRADMVQYRVDKLKNEIGASNADHKEEEDINSEKVEGAKTALAERYNLAPEDFMHIKYVDDEDNTVHTVVLATKEGLDLGNPSKDYDNKRSYSSIMSNDKKNKEAHTVEIDGVDHDDRTGMTLDAHSALAEARESKIDREKWTIMTGEPLTAGGDAQLADVLDVGYVRRDITSVGDVYRFLGFRPAVVL